MGGKRKDGHEKKMRTKRGARKEEQSKAIWELSLRD